LSDLRVSNKVKTDERYFVRFGSIAAQLFSLSVGPCPLLSNRVLNGAVQRTQSCAISDHQPISLGAKNKDRQ
jgi:hypothetical protein